MGWIKKGKGNRTTNTPTTVDAVAVGAFSDGAMADRAMGNRDIADGAIADGFISDGAIADGFIADKLMEPQNDGLRLRLVVRDKFCRKDGGEPVLGDDEGEDVRDESCCESKKETKIEQQTHLER